MSTIIRISFLCMIASLPVARAHGDDFLADAWHEAVSEWGIYPDVRLDFFRASADGRDCQNGSTGAFADAHTREIVFNGGCNWMKNIKNPREFVQIIEHEIGHILSGRPIHSGEKDSVMFWATDGNLHRRITATDRWNAAHGGPL